MNNSTPSDASLISFEHIPLGARFRYVGSNQVWTVINKYRKVDGKRLFGTIAAWEPDMLKRGRSKYLTRDFSKNKNKNMVVYNKIIPQTVDIYNSDGFFANVNEYEFNDIRIQIMNEKVEGFYVLFSDRRLNINSSGRVSDWPEGFFSLHEDQLFKLISW